MTKQSSILLVRILSAIESVWRPIRQHHSKGDAIYAARQANTAPGGGTVAQRKSSERARAELRAAGLLIGGLLLPAGRRLARRWTWPFDQSQLIDGLQRIKSLVADGDCRRGGYAPESLIAGAWDMDAFALLQAMLIPCLADGVLESSCTSQGHKFYRFADVVSPDDVPEVVAAQVVDADGDDMDRELFEVYTAEFAAT